MADIDTFRPVLKKHRVAGIDSSVFIYHFEQHPQYGPLTAVLFDRLDGGEMEIVTSAVTVSEVLVRPFEKHDIEVITLYEAVFDQLPYFTLVPIDYRLAKSAASLRAEYRIRLPDAFQIAAALKENASIFITNDRALKKVTDLKVVCLEDYS